jgi:hypothetical protein
MDPRIRIRTKISWILNTTFIYTVPQVSLPQLSEPVEISPGLYTRRQSGKEKKVHLPGTATYLYTNCKGVVRFYTFVAWGVL